MKPGFYLLAAAAVAIAAPPARAQSWTEVQRTNDGIVVYFDAASAARTASRVRFTLRYVMPGTNPDYGIARAEIDCAARTARIVDMTNFRAGGEVVATFGGTEPDAIRDGTAWATVAATVCVAPAVR